ncbi:helix-turn-helix domain-containing protein, partial [Pseudomonas amygdali]
KIFWGLGVDPLKGGGCSIAETARLAGVSVSQVKRVWSQYLAAKADV